MFGRTSTRRLRRALAPKGRLVIVGGEGDRWTGGIQRQVGAPIRTPLVDQKLLTFIAKENTSTLERMNDLITREKVQPPTTRRHPLVDAARAVDAVERGATADRLVLTI